MEESAEFTCPRFREGVTVDLQPENAVVTLGTRHCRFEFPGEARVAIARMFGDLQNGGLRVQELPNRLPEIVDEAGDLIETFNSLRFLREADSGAAEVVSGAQLYRELRRIADRVAQSAASSTFYRALVDGAATTRHLIGYGLEYYWLVRSAPGLIAPAVASAHSMAERRLLENFLSSEIGHDKFIGAALEAVGITVEGMDQHQPLPATFSLGASLGVYARQHPMSFKACLFLLEEARPEFVDAFDRRCETLSLPSEFFLPFREHADLNADFDHGDISRDLLTLEGAISFETCEVVKAHVALMIETIIQLEEQIMNYYGKVDSPMPRIFV